MQIIKMDDKKQRQVIIGSIVSKTFLTRVASIWNDELLPSDTGNLIVRWCVEYFRKYEDAPRKAIERIFTSWADEIDSEEKVEAVSRLLGSLSGEYEELAEEYEQTSAHLLDLAGEYFSEVAMRRLIFSMQSALDSGNVTEAESRWANFKKPKIGISHGVDVLTDPTACDDIFEPREKNVLVQYPGELGLFLDRTMEREGFVCFMAPDKVGKSQILLDVALTAVEQRRKTVFFSVGDMSERQVKQRIAVRLAGKPIYSRVGWPLTIKVPDRIELIRERRRTVPDVSYIEKKFKSPLDKRQMQAAYNEFMEDRVKSKDSYFKLSCHPSSSINIAEIDGILSTWETLLDWSVEVIVIDYADLLAPLPGTSRMQEHDQINQTWMKMRALCQRRRCLLVTASQTNKDAYSAKLLTRKNFSGDKRKLSHVTAMLGINRTPADRKRGVMRLNFVVGRETDLEENDVIYTAPCLALCNPFVLCVRK